MKIEKQAVIRLNLLKQGLYHAPQGDSQEDAVDLLRRLGCIQLDTLNVVTRSHNLVFLARMAHYEEEWFTNFYRDKQVVEAYIHALSILPTDEYQHIRPVFQMFGERTELLAPEQAAYLEALLELVRERAPVTSRELNAVVENPAFFANRTWNEKDWKVSHVRWGLDRLWRSGRLIQTRDPRFGKVYHDAEEWVAEDLRTPEMSRADMVLRYTRLALQAMGVASEIEIADYFRMSREEVRAALQKLIAEEEVCEAEVVGEKETHYVLTADLPLLDTVPTEEPPSHSALLSPFDSLIWHRGRALKLFGIDFRLECYTPEPQRQFGYYALPILIRGRIVGTLDLKMDRKTRRLTVKRHIPLDEQDHDEEITSLLQHLAQFLGAVEIEKSPRD